MVLEKLIITRSINDIEMKYTYSLTKESLNNVQAVSYTHLRGHCLKIMEGCIWYIDQKD